MAIKVIVFDFDGTLVDSNRLKYNAFFEVFPADEHHVRTIRTVLSELNEQSRFVILEEILQRLGLKKGAELRQKVKELAERYNEIVLSRAKSCPEMPAAEAMLKSLSQRYRLYVSSTTPDTELKDIIGFRNWRIYFEDIYGYPHQKSATIQHIMERDSVRPSQVLVVGDGNSDRQSAENNACCFVQVTPNFNLRDLNGIIADL
jgi:phosphoglycolate phosphatase-like HAD superfamily hydrolase